MSDQAYLDQVKARSAKTPGDFRRLAAGTKLVAPMAKAAAFIDWLAQDCGPGRGRAVAIHASLRGKTGRRGERIICQNAFA